MFKTALLFTNYGPYHFARFDATAQTFLSKGGNAFGIELARSEVEYPWETQRDRIGGQFYTVIDDIPLEDVKFSHLSWQLISVLNQTSPDILAIAGYARPSMLVALLWCLWHCKSAILLSETTEYDEVRSWWKEKIKKLIISRYKAALVGGQPQKRYLVKLGMPSSAIFLGYDVVGNEAFHPNHIRSLRHPVDKQFFLAINRFVTKKNLLFLLSSYADYRQILGTDAWDLVLCGDGELRTQIEQKIQKLNLQDHVHLTGFLQQEQMLPYFANAGCFIHASIQEQWGLVVNEAMAAGLPVLVSDRCGCFEDLVIEGVNGFGFDPTNPQQLTDLMVKVSSGEIDLETMGKAALEHIQKFSPDTFAQGLMQAVEYALAHQ